MKTLITRTLAAAAAATFALAALPSAAQNLMISSALPQVHPWTGKLMDVFADRMEADSDITFTRFYGGELTGVGRGLDALQGGTVDIVSPLLAPYHPGVFPLTDISQLPVYGTDAPAITRAFQKLLDSDEALQDGKTFYELEIGGKGIKVWGLGATGAYAINTSTKKIESPEDFKGMPMRAGAALQTMTLERLGVNPVTMPAPQAYEALSRKTLDGILLSIADWKSFSLIEILKHSIVGVALGHWESYHAISERAWNGLTPEQQETFDRDIRAVSMENAVYIEDLAKQVQETAIASGSEFTDVKDLTPELQAFIAKAAADTWKQWIETLEKNGHPARAAAKLWAKLIIEEGGALPDGVEAYLAEG